jgi:hypothetical protein
VFSLALVVVLFYYLLKDVNLALVWAEIQAIMSLVDHLGQGWATEVGQLDGLEAGPQALDRVQLRGVGGQALDHQPGPLGRQPGPHGGAAMGGQPIPQQGRLLTAEELPQLAQDPNEGVGVVVAGRDVEGQLSATTADAITERGRHRGLLPVERVRQHRRPATRRPGAAHVGVRLSADSSKKTRQALRRWAFP